MLFGNAELQSWVCGVCPWENTNAEWLVDLRADNSSLPEQAPVTISGREPRKSLKYEELDTDPGPDMIHTYFYSGV